MTDDTPPTMTSTQRAAFMQAERVNQLRAEVEAAEARVSAGFGAEVLPVFRMTVAEWLEVLRSDLLEAEADWEFLRARIEGADE